MSFLVGEGLPGAFLTREWTQGDQHKETPVDNLRLACSSTDFAFSLYKQLALKNPDKNVIFSPMSICIALGFLSLGARGTTLTEILKVLKFDLAETTETEIHQGFQHLLRTLSQPSTQMQLNVGNAMFVNEQVTLLDKFREDAKALYASEVFSADFRNPTSAEKLINDYVKEKTQGKIVHLVKGLDPSAAMVLVNYIYFKAKWEKPFKPYTTFQSNFYVSESRLVKVSMMTEKDLTTPYFRDEELACTVVELSYTSNASALFILPDQGAMKKVEDALLPKNTEEVERFSADETYRPLPAKIFILLHFELDHILAQLGMREVFTSLADLSGVTGVKNLPITQVVHKAVIDVGEKGTEAVAATGLVCIGCCFTRDPVIVNFNRPFLLSILSKDTQSIIFSAKVTNPNEK